MTNNNIIIINFFIKYLQTEYERFSEIINTFMVHIDRIFYENIITANDRNQYMKSLNDNIIVMNNIYNDKKNSYTQSDSKNNKIPKLDKNIVELLEKNYTFENVAEYLKTIRLTDTELDFFKDVSAKLLKLSSLCGFYNINVSLELFIGDGYSKLILTDKYDTFRDKLNIINKLFVPLSFSTKKIKNKNHNIYCNYYNDASHDVLIENYGQVHIILPCKSMHLTYGGYFVCDPLNINLKTSQICNHQVYEKKNALTIYTTELKINEQFKIGYMKNLNICDILCHDKKTFIDKFKSDYNLYNKYSCMSFKNIMNEFINDDTTIKKQFSIIKLFLLGISEENTNMAGMLFNLIKDKKLNNTIIADIIYKNLNYSMQNKLRKSNISIKNELLKLKNMSTDSIDVKKQIIMCNNMPQYIKKIAFDKTEEMKVGGGEYYKQKTYLDIILNYPWLSEKSEDIFHRVGKNIQDSKIFLDNVVTVLGNKVYGHDECKSVMQELIGKWLTNPNSKGKVVGLVGPPGVGKTLIAKSLGDALQIPFVQINLGGMEDRCILSGHSYTYSAAQPGLIIRKMIEAGNSRCIMYFDELDKTSTKHGINEIYNVLIHITDPNTNMAYSDSFFNEIVFRLDKVLFVFSYNDTEKVDKILLDRMEKIEVKPYCLIDKLVIAKKFILKEITTDINLPLDIIEFNDDDLIYIIENFTQEAGVRDLKRKLETIYLKINLDRIYKRNLFEDTNTDVNNSATRVITRDIIDKFLNKSSHYNKKTHVNNQVGVINGLYATSVGTGGIIPIVINKNHTGANFELKLTGNQGKIMQESVHYAFNTAMSIVKQSYIDSFKKEFPLGLHIHALDANTPKEGASATVSFLIAIISVILNKKIRSDIALTGEIEINGNITAIGGLVHKINGANKAGIKTVFIPQENKDDLDKIYKKEPTLEKEIDIKLVNNVTEILKYVLLEDSIKNTNNDETIDITKYLSIVNSQ